MDYEKQQQILDLCFSRLYNQFNAMVSKFGGKKFEKNLKNIFLSQAKGKGFHNSGAINLKEASIDWVDYRNLTAELIKFTAGVVGKNTVEKEVQAILDEIEQEFGESIYEIRFKLGLHVFDKK